MSGGVFEKIKAMKDKREQDMQPVQQPVQPQSPLPQFPQQPLQPQPQAQPSQPQPSQPQVAPPTGQAQEPPLKKIMDKLTTSEIEEEIMVLDDAEKRELAILFQEKHNLLLKEIKDKMKRIDDEKHKKKEEIDKDHRRRVDELEEEYERLKMKIASEKKDEIERAKNMALKFKAHGGYYNEDLFRKKAEPPKPTFVQPPPKIDTAHIEEKRSPPAEGEDYYHELLRELGRID